jgi:plastocyanin
MKRAIRSTSIARILPGPAKIGRLLHDTVGRLRLAPFVVIIRIQPMKRYPPRLATTLRLLALCALPALLAGSAAAHNDTADVIGSLVLVQDGRSVLDGVDQAVVFFTPAKKAKLTVAEAVPEMATSHKEFRPRMLVVPVGTKVRFPNQDPILHNAFSVSGGNAFDVGLYSRGAGKTVTMKEAGLVRVFCNVHQSMAGYVLVVDTPYAISPDKRGIFSLSGLPTGAGTLSIWHERGAMQTQQVTLPLAAPLRLALTVTKPRVPRHLNKFGKAYSSDRAYR